MRTTKTQICLRIRTVWSLFIRCLDSIMPLISVYEISSLLLASVTEQAGFSLTWSEIPKTVFIVTNYEPSRIGITNPKADNLLRNAS